MIRMLLAGGALVTLAAGGVAGADSTTAGSSAAAAAAAKPGPQAQPAPAAGGPEVAVLKTTQGTIVIKFHQADAPLTCANFKKLVREQYYDGTCFHRVIPGFMIQGGDPNSRNPGATNLGSGGPGYTVPAEIKLKHLRGSVATARTGDYVNPKRESSGSQFFIDVGPQPSLDAGGYTVFGQVISGMDAVDKIVAFGNDTTLPMAGGGGRNPGKKAQIIRATLEPLARWEKAAGAPRDTLK